MDKIKMARKKIDGVKLKLKASKKRLQVAERDNKSEKQIAVCQKHVSGWTDKLRVAKENLAEVKSQVKAEKGSIVKRVKSTPIKRTLSYSGLAVAVVIATAVGAFFYDKSKNGNTEGALASDSI